MRDAGTVRDALVTGRATAAASRRDQQCHDTGERTQADRRDEEDREPPSWVSDPSTRMLPWSPPSIDSMAAE